MSIPSRAEIEKIEQQIQSIDNVIHRLKCRQVEVGEQQRALVTSDYLAQWVVSYLRFSHRLRLPRYRFELWVPGVITVVTALIGACTFVVAHIATNSVGQSAISSGLVSCVIASAATVVLCVPRTDRLVEILIEASTKEDDARMALAFAKHELAGLKDELFKLTAQRNSLAGVIDKRRRILLQRDWRSLRGTDWEKYLAEVFIVLGADVELTKASGDHGVDLVVNTGVRRVAVQAKGYNGVVDNKAVQEAVAGRAMYDCQYCAVITNSRFTRNARKLAEKNNCLLIDGDSVVELVMGRLRL